MKPAEFVISLGTGICGILLLLIVAIGVSAQTIDPRAESGPVANAFPLATAPLVDGEVKNDPAWQENRKPITGFWQVRPDDGQPATQKTEVFVGFTEKAIYIGVICYDDNPKGIIVADSRRDSDMDDTDSFQVILDSFMDQQNGFVFGTNPAGIEYDGQVTKEGSGSFGSGGGGFNLNWDTAWAVKAVISDIGWSAEMEIPFKSLRYGAQSDQTWGINFQRNIRRNNEVVYWSPLPRQHNLYRLSDAGTLEGLEVPVQRNLKLTPYGLGKKVSGGNLQSDTEYDFGFDLKYSLTPGLTLDVTYNTDFAQVEVDELQVNLDRFSLFLPEQRPFFLENAGQFAVGVPKEVEIFFSRRIGIGPDGEQIPIDGGARISGKIGDTTNVGFLHMRSESVEGIAPQNDYTVARVSQELPNRSSVGAIFVNREGAGSSLAADDDDYNRTFAVDGRWGMGDDTTVSGFLARSETPGLSGDDHAMMLRADYNARDWSSMFSYSEVGENFNPEVGFLSRDGYRKATGFLMRRYRPDNLWGLHELRPHISFREFWDFDDFHETGYVHVDNHWEWKSGMELHTGVNFLHEGVKEPFEMVDGKTVQPGVYDDHELSLVFLTNQGAPLSFRLSTRIGGLFGGNRIGLSPQLRYRIGETFTSELSWDYNDIDLPGSDSFKINLGRLRLTYSFSPKISLQALVQYNDQENVVATNLRFAWQTSADTGLYLVFNEFDDSDISGKPRREIILKYSQILDLLR